MPSLAARDCAVVESRNQNLSEPARGQCRQAGGALKARTTCKLPLAANSSGWRDPEARKSPPWVIFSLAHQKKHSLLSIRNELSTFNVILKASKETKEDEAEKSGFPPSPLGFCCTSVRHLRIFVAHRSSAGTQPAFPVLENWLFGYISIT